MFESTIPFGEPELMRASAYQQYLRELDDEAAKAGVSSRISSLSPSLRADLYRFEADGGTSEVLEVVAACVRHAKRVAIHLQCEERVVPLTVFPEERLVHCPMPLGQLLAKPLTELRVLHVEPAMLRPPGDEESALVGDEKLHFPLAPLLWELAMQGGRTELLPEIVGPAVYRVTPGLQLGSVPASNAVLASIYRLRSEGSTLSDIAEWPGMDRERAVRLLNALYLQAGLMVSRSHPDAINESWKRKPKGSV
ncbi:MAG TPA: hypothetical protein VF169_06235 [Albitalea sp.]|uniref:hypothetical protein n=1 Tax=Piscinibacter sp. TaxID=1903157 RepID=UPI002ED1ABAE